MNQEANCGSQLVCLNDLVIKFVADYPHLAAEALDEVQSIAVHRHCLLDTIRHAHRAER